MRTCRITSSRTSEASTTRPRRRPHGFPSELEELRIKVEKSEDARIAYERENQIWQIDEKQDITTQKLADLSKAVTEAQTDAGGEGSPLPNGDVGERGCAAGGP